MDKLKTIDNKLVGIAIGKENDKWYVQTTDIASDTYLSELIEDNLNDIEKALAIAKSYQDEYNMKVAVWDDVKVYIEGYGSGTVIGNDLNDDYPIIVEFESPVHTSESVGYFNINQIQFV